MKIRVWNKIEQCYEEVIDDPNHPLSVNYGIPLFRLPLDASTRRYGFKVNRDDHPFATLSNVIGSPDFYQIEEVPDEFPNDEIVFEIHIDKK